jgi:hypothetical protein
MAWADEEVRPNLSDRRPILALSEQNKNILTLARTPHRLPLPSGKSNPMTTATSYNYPIIIDTTLSGPVQLPPGAVFDIAAGVTLTVTGPFDAPRERVFTGAGSVKFADGAVEAVRPEWWGFAADATAAVNDAARLAARESITLRGTVRFPTGAFLVSAYVPINRSFIRFVGDSRFGTVFVTQSATGDVTGIDGTMQPGFPTSSDPIDECQHLGIGVLRSVASTAGLTGGVPTGAKGFIHRLATNAMIEGKFGDSPIDYYESRTSGGRVDIVTTRNALADTTAYRFGVVSDCTIPSFPGASANGSSYKRLVDVVNDGFTGEAWGVYVYGADLRDGFWQSVETSGGHHAFDIIAPVGAGAQAFDIHVLFCVLDGWKKTGLRIVNLPAGSKLAVAEGYSAPGVADPALGPSVQISASSGVTIGRGFEAKGGSNFADHTAVSVENGSARFIVECNITGAKTGVSVDASSLGIISVSCEPHAGQPMTTGISLTNGASRVKINNGILDGPGGIACGIRLDASSTYNTIGDYNINPGSVTTPIIINGSAVTTLSGAAYVNVNHNRVLAGALDDGL